MHLQTRDPGLKLMKQATISTHQTENKLCLRSCNLFLRASASGHLPKRHVQVAMYSFPLSVFGRGPTISISTVCQTWWVTECLMEFGAGTLVFVTGLGHLQYSNISNLLLHLVLPTVLNWLGQCGKLGGLAVSAQILSPTYWAQRNIFVIKSFFLFRVKFWGLPADSITKSTPNTPTPTPPPPTHTHTTYLHTFPHPFPVLLRKPSFWCLVTPSR